MENRSSDNKDSKEGHTANTVFQSYEEVSCFVNFQVIYQAHFECNY